MSATTLHFISVGGTGAAVKGESSDLRGSDVKLIRSAAMRDFRRRQRECIHAGSNASDGKGHRNGDAWRERCPRDRGKQRHKVKVASQVAQVIEAPHSSRNELVAERPSALLEITRFPSDSRSVVPNAVSDRLPIKSFTRPGRVTATPHLLRITASMPQSIRSPEAVRLALATHCARAYFPEGLCSSLVLDRFLQSCSSQKVRCCSDAVHLLYCGTSVSHEAMAIEGRKRHIAAMSDLRRKIQRPWESPASLIAAVWCLMMCESFVEVLPGSWTGHVRALNIIVNTARQQAKPLEGFPYRQARHVNLMHALVFRLRMELDLDYWCQRDAPSHGHEALIQLAVRLPALLYAADRASEDRTVSSATVAKIALRLLRLEAALVDWEESSSVPPADSLHFRVGCAELPSSPSPDTSHYITCSLNSFQQTLLLSIRSSLLDLRADLPTLAPSFAAAAATIAASTRASVSQLLAKSNSPISRALSVRLQLHILARWYRRSNDDDGLAWLEDIEERLKGEVRFVKWDGLLPFSRHGLFWLVAKPVARS